ncbi:MAG: phenylalanine--tRNA ligase subunit alpha [Phycisphaerales bacterium]|nr:phenylalanine--tRNA ligase subunit alpha [Phycisphaerales bacterium]
MNLDDLLQSAQADLAAAANSQQLEAFRIKYLGTKGLLKDASDHLRTVPGPEKRNYGQKLNQVKNSIAVAFEEKKSATSPGTGGGAVPGLTGVDITEPGRLAFSDYRPGSLHIITQTIHELAALFARMGFTIAEGPEVEDDFHNFDALNIPKTHPARDPLDSFYLTPPSSPGTAVPGLTPGERCSYMLRSQTSSVQIRVMQKQKPPIRIIAPGRVYRPDTVDATHLFQFHQLEALVVDEGISMIDLRTTIDQFVKAYFGHEGGGVQTRFRPFFFPFTEPSAEVDVLVPWTNGSTRWIEIGGCGMVDPNVLTACNIDSERYTGWAFGFGIERLIMRKHNIVNSSNEPDIRTLVENDLRFLQQF